MARLQGCKLEEEVVIAAAENKNCEILSLLLDRRGNEIIITEDIAEVTARFGYKSTMAMLLERRGSDFEITPQLLRGAISNSHNSKAMLTVLLEQSGSQVTITEELLEQIAGNAYNGSELMGVVLDLRGDEIEITERVLQSAAANNGDGVKVLQVLFDQVGKLEITDHVVMTAATSGLDNTLKFLEKVSDFGDEKHKWFDISHLSGAVKAGDIKAVRRLVQDETPLDIPDTDGNTPLWWASRHGYTDIVQILLATKAVNVNVQGQYGETPLFTAATRGFPEAVQLLLDYGARQDIKPILGAESPLEFVRSLGHHRIVDILTKHQQQVQPKDEAASDIEGSLMVRRRRKTY